jgi:hypothetical protein
MYSCPSCASHSVVKKGSYYNRTEAVNKQRYKCKDCEFQFSVEIPKTDESYSNLNKKRYVITSCHNDTRINEDFYEALNLYCEVNDAQLIVLRTKYKLLDDIKESYNVPSELILAHNLTLADNIKIFGGLNLMPTLVSPLSGLDTLSAGYTCIFGHPTVQLKTLPVNADQHPIIMTTTGSISYPNNSDTKTGQKADYSHTFGAVILEMDNEVFHIRRVEADDTGGFYDLDKYYADDLNVTEGHRIDAIVLGDVHVDVADPVVIDATFNYRNSIINTLKPKKVVFHDLLDFNQLQSHHNKNNYLKRFQKYIRGEDDITKELEKTVQFLVDHTPDFVEENIIVSSNHIDHLDKFLNLADIKNDYKNSIIYHFLMYGMLVAIQNGEDTNAFKLFFNHYCDNKQVKEKTKFLGREDSYFVHDILVSNHGDVGLGGSRFSPTQSRRFPHKMITGHSHQIFIEGGLYVAGTCTGKLDYASGVPSAWVNSHVIVYPNGKRTHINIIRGKWKL